jgi:hypothetical protein
MDEKWWTLPGPAAFLRAAWDDLRDGKNVVLALPTTAPAGLRDALAALVRQAELWAWRDFVAGDGDGGPLVLVERLHRQLAPPLQTAALLSAATLAADPRLADTVIWVEGMTAACWPAWRDLLSQYERACQARPEQGRGLFCVPLTGNVGRTPEPAVALRVLPWRSAVGGIDILLDLSMRENGEALSPLHRRLAQEVACELALTDAALARALHRLDLRTLLEPTEFLRAEAGRRGWDARLARQPSWEEGLLDVVDGEEVVHSAVLAIRGEDDELRRRVWRAEVRVLFPFLEEQRLRLLPRLRPHLRLPVQTTYGPVHDAFDLELGQLVHFLRGRNLPTGLWRQLTRLADMRHDLAHLRLVPVESLFAEELRAPGDR